MKAVLRWLRLTKPSDAQLEATRNLVRDLIASSTLFALLHTGARACSPVTTFFDYVFLMLLFIGFVFVITWSSFITDLNLRHIPVRISRDGRVLKVEEIPMGEVKK